MNDETGTFKTTVEHQPNLGQYVECPMCKTKDFAFTQIKVNRKRDKEFAHRMKFGFCEDCGVFIIP